MSSSESSRNRKAARLSGFLIWSGKPGSNWRPQPWQGCALPTELFPRIPSIGHQENHCFRCPARAPLYLALFRSPITDWRRSAASFAQPRSKLLPHPTELFPRSFVAKLPQQPHYIGIPKGSRTPVTAVKGRCPRPLDDGDRKLALTSRSGAATLPWHITGITLRHLVSSQQRARTKKAARSSGFRFGAGNRVRTGDLNLGKVALYQLSYSREFFLSGIWRTIVSDALPERLSTLRSSGPQSQIGAVRLRASLSREANSCLTQLSYSRDSVSRGCRSNPAALASPRGVEPLLPP